MKRGKSANEAANIGMVVFAHYPADPRVRREAEALVQANMQVDVICLRNDREPGVEIVNNVTVHRLPVRKQRAGRLNYMWEYAFFIFLAFVKLTRLHVTKRYRAIHVHNMPDILIVSALIPRLTGAKIILDLHDPMPEVFMTKYAIAASHPFIRLLVLFEKLSLRLADLALTPNRAFRELFIARGCPPDKIHLIMNSPMETIFCRNQAQTHDTISPPSSKFVLMYHGFITERHGLDTALEAIARVRNKIPHLAFEVYGQGDSFIENFLRLREKLNLDGVVQYYGLVSQETIAGRIRGADVGIIPNKKTVFTNLNLPTRIFEYLCLGKSVIAPSTRGIADYFDENALHFFEPGNVSSLADTILQVYQNPAARRAVLAQGVEVYRAHTWEKQQQRLVELMRELVGISAPEQITR